MKPGGFQKLLELDGRATGQLSIAEQPGFLRSISIFFAHSGDSWFWLVGLIVLWWLGTDAWKDRAITMIFGIALTALVVFIIKLIVRRRRPEGEWGKFYRKTDPHSFPSGHAARAAMLAAVALGMGPPWFGLVILLWAPLVILARVAMGVHYLSDVLVGSMLGMLMGLVVLTIPLPI